MKDQLLFKEQTLKNGLTVFWQQKEEVGYYTVRIVMPGGTANNAAPLKMGSFHFLEHLVAEQAANESQSINNFIGLNGGYNNATTFSHHTTFSLTIPKHNFEKVCQPYLNSIFKPIINRALIIKQASIIANERQQKERWYPANNELGQYVRTKWMQTTPWPIEQIFGNRSELENIKDSDIATLQKYHLSKNNIVLVIGPEKPTILINYLSSLKTTNPKLKNQQLPIGWKRQTNHSHQFKDLAHPMLIWGGLVKQKSELAEVRAVSFILNYLTNYIHGPLYGWLRHDLGWAYSLYFDLFKGDSHLEWTISIPLNSISQTNQVKKQLCQKVAAALGNQTAINQEVDRIIAAAEAFDFQTAEGVINEAESFYRSYGRVVTVKELLECINQCRDINYLQRIYKTYFNPQQTSFLTACPHTSS